jgi:hypothetical protein
MRSGLPPSGGILFVFGLRDALFVLVLSEAVLVLVLVLESPKPNLSLH